MSYSSTHIIFLKGRKTILRPLHKETDLPLITRWINDPEIRRYVSNYIPQTISMEEEWIDSLSKKTNTDIVLIIEAVFSEGNSVPIGTMGIHDINWKHRFATTGALIGEKNFWGRGYGTDAKMVVLDYIFNTLNMHRVCSDVFAYNKRSLSYSLHCGYKIEGVRRKHFFQEGKYHDVIELGLFKKEWLPIWKKYKKTGSVV